MPSDLVRLRKRKESTNYQLQITVPADLRQHFNGQRLIRQSLGTGDRKEAEARALRAALPIWQRFCELRQPAYAQPSSLDQGLFLEASLAYLNDRASEESRRVAKLIEDGKEDERAHAEASWDALHSLLADEVDPEYGQPPHRRLECEENHATANAVLARLGLSLDALSPTDRVWALREAEWLRADLYLIMEECCAAIPTGVRRAEIFRRRRDALPHLTPAQVAEAPTRTPSPNQDRPRRGKTKTLSDVLPEWQARTNAKPHAIQDTERALALWEEATENPAIGE
ncbi:MAG TPA: DUF6538 domain-containing protein, partial [Burkholderiaceae bacterium]|nr:DUF6538 domain-containing protein [Burkholderiaceae bacterium]